eukprot:145280-Pyramimonas_sp.AAC.1
MSSATAQKSSDSDTRSCSNLDIFPIGELHATCMASWDCSQQNGTERHFDLDGASPVNAYFRDRMEYPTRNARPESQSDMSNN